MMNIRILPFHAGPNWTQFLGAGLVGCIEDAVETPI
jgi:hypothetical protein